MNPRVHKMNPNQSKTKKPFPFKNPSWVLTNPKNPKGYRKNPPTQMSPRGHHMNPNPSHYPKITINYPN